MRSLASLGGLALLAATASAAAASPASPAPAASAGGSSNAPANAPTAANGAPAVNAPAANGSSPPTNAPTPATAGEGDSRVQEARREPTAGDLATARTALREGLSLREKGDLEGARSRLSSAYDLVPTPVTGFELGKTQMMAGNILQAHELFRKVQRMPLSMEESARSSMAREEAQRLAKDLEPRIPSLRIRVRLPPGASVSVRVDDAQIATTGAETLRAVDPGAHEVTAKAGDGPEQKVSIVVAESETRDVDLAPQWVPPKAPEPSIDGKRVFYVRQTNPLVFIGFGLSSASLVFTTIAGIVAVNHADDVRDQCGDTFCAPEVLRRDGGIAAAWVLATVIGAGATASFLVMGAISVGRPVKERVVAEGPPRPRDVPRPKPSGVTLSPTVGFGAFGVEGRF